jgi:hypothetical protein
MPWRRDRNTFTDEDRNNMDVEFVDPTSVHERGDQAGAAHHPDQFPRSHPMTLCKPFYWLRYKFDARCDSLSSDRPLFPVKDRNIVR